MDYAKNQGQLEALNGSSSSCSERYGKIGDATTAKGAFTVVTYNAHPADLKIKLNGAKVKSLIYGSNHYISKVYLTAFGCQAYPVGFLGNSLKLRRGFGVIRLEFHWSASGKV